MKKLEPALPEEWSEEAPGVPRGAQYGLSLLLVAVATLLGFAVEPLVSAPNLTLIFVVPVVIAATAFGWGPSLIAVFAGVLAFDFFFTEPKFSFVIASAADAWAAALLFVTAAIVSTVAAESRRRALETRSLLAQTRALQALAHLVIGARPQAEVVEAAAAALSQMGRGPAAIFREQQGSLKLVASAGDARIGGAEEDAARAALRAHVPTRAGAYPADGSAFDFWPVTLPSGGAYALGIDFSRAPRPPEPGIFVEAVGAYLAASAGAGAE